VADKAQPVADEVQPVADEVQPIDVLFNAEARAFMSRVMTGYESMVRRVCDMADSASARTERLELALQRSIEAQLDAVKEREELLSMRHQRELDTKLTERKAEAISDLSRDVRSLAPLVMKKFMGIPLTGNDSHGLSDFLNAMGEEQVYQLMTTGELRLSVSQRQLLGQTIMALAEDEKKKRAAEGEAEAEVA